MAFLEEGELYFLANKLRETYGTPALLRESMYFVQPTRTNVYVKMAAKRGSNTTRKLLTGETNSENNTSSHNDDENDDNSEDEETNRKDYDSNNDKQILDNAVDSKH